MFKRKDKEFLCDIGEAIERIKNYIGKMDYEKFLNDNKTQDAVIRNIEIIGEAVKNLSQNLKKKYSSIEWKDIAGMRDKIIHHYFGIKWEIVWSVIKNKLPNFREKVKNIIEDLENK